MPLKATRLRLWAIDLKARTSFVVVTQLMAVFEYFYA